MDIPALSMISSQVSLQQTVGIAILKKTMDNMDTSAANLISSMVPPSTTIGTNIDISV